jgi:hypothetical protein
MKLTVSDVELVHVGEFLCPLHELPPDEEKYKTFFIECKEKIK